MRKRPSRQSLALKEFDHLLTIVKALRGPQGCPWDRKQTHGTLTRYAIEEAFELAEAIDKGQAQEMIEELGDLLFQVALHSEIGRQKKKFTVADVIRVLNEKMIRRHPHVFGAKKLRSAEAVVKQWQIIKSMEKPKTRESLLDGIPRGFSALLTSQKIGERTRPLKFDWTNIKGVWAKVEEEKSELRSALRSGRKKRMEDELGDLLFSLAQLARHLNLDAEQALRKANRRFDGRFSQMQKLVKKDNKDWNRISAQIKEKYWRRAKNQVRKSAKGTL